MAIERTNVLVRQASSIKCRRFAVVLAVIVVIPKPTTGQPPSHEDDTQAKNVVRDFSQAAAATYEISVNDDTVLHLQKEPVLGWSNPVRNSKYGYVFVWTDNGRPAVIASIHLSTRVGWRNEFQSLTRKPIEAVQESRIVWSTKQPGIDWAPLDTDDAPADSRARRLTQMRNLARLFSAKIGKKNSEELRLMTQPLYRYSSPDDQILDGALFAFVQGTDIEALLLIEATGQPESPWRYGFSRMTGWPVEARYRGKVVWTVPSGGVGQQSQAYYNRLIGEVPGSPE